MTRRGNAFTAPPEGRVVDAGGSCVCLPRGLSSCEASLCLSSLKCIDDDVARWVVYYYGFTLHILKRCSITVYAYSRLSKLSDTDFLQWKYIIHNINIYTYFFFSACRSGHLPTGAAAHQAGPAAAREMPLRKTRTSSARPPQLQIARRYSCTLGCTGSFRERRCRRSRRHMVHSPVSYTHLTLPTNDLV